LPPLKSEEVYVLRSPSVLASTANYFDGIQKFKQPDSPVELIIVSASGAYIGFSRLDLTNVEAITFITEATKRRNYGAKVEVHLDSPKGKLIGESTDIVLVEGQPAGFAKALITETKGIHDVYFVFKNDGIIAGKQLAVLKELLFHPKK
jgi:cytochrome c